jgi:hypothetical protein
VPCPARTIWKPPVFTADSWEGLRDITTGIISEGYYAFRNIIFVRIMKFGLLFINNGHQDMYLPIFCKDRELAYSVLNDAMKKWVESEKRDHWNYATSFHRIVDKLGTERRGTGPHDCPLFLSLEAVSQQCFGGVDSACKDADYIFAVDFENQKIVTLK